MARDARCGGGTVNYSKYDRRPAPRVSATARLDTLATAIGYTVIAGAVLGTIVLIVVSIVGVLT